MPELGVLLNSDLVAFVEQERDGDFVLTYEQEWQDRIDSYPVSVSMPLAARVHGDDLVRPFLEGLLPDSDRVLRRWAREFRVSARNPFALLTHMGEDCAGALRFVRPERFDAPSDLDEGEVEWLTDDQIAERLRDLVDHHGTGRLAGDPGHFSLAGAQPKTAFLREGNRWGIPSGRTPTTHILKPPARDDLDGFDINEHFCLRLARELGLAAAESTLMHFGDQAALVVERYDRYRVGGGRWMRLHQEDACQALAVSPLEKYENQGGPGTEQIIRLLLDESDDPGTDVGAFVDAVALNWIIAGTDAHAKNFSLLLFPKGVRLAPFYDLISILPYTNLAHRRETKLAMRIGREYHLWKIGRRHWERFANECDLDTGPVLHRVGELVDAVPGAVERAAATLAQEGVDHPIVERLTAAIGGRCEECIGALERA